MERCEDYKNSFHSWAIDAFLNTSNVDDPNITWFGKCIGKALNNPEKKVDGPFIIGLCGNAGTGKDSATDYLRSCPYIDGGVYRVAFADPIREIAKLFGFTQEQLTDRTLKEAPDEFWGFSPRTFMQKVGTEMFRDCLRDDIWIKLLEKRITDIKNCIDRRDGCAFETVRPKIIFITDVRFPNEAEAIRKMGGYIFKITREGFSKSGENLHPSEKFINEMQADSIFNNKCKNADEWSWYFAKYLTIFFKHDAFYYNLKEGE